MNPVTIPFLNLQYFYCIIVSWLGKACTTVGQGGIDVTIPSVGTTTVQTVTTSGGSFWSWLWPFGSSAGSAVDTGTSVGQSVGFWAGIFNALPTPIAGVILTIGSIASFLWTTFSWLSYAFSGIVFLGILAAIAGIVFIRLKEWKAYGTLRETSAAQTFGWNRWQDILNEGMSTDPKRWKAGIMAADAMLGELLAKLGYIGENTGEQMRKVPEDAFVTLPAAWEAHRIKNFIAAKSSNYILTQREAFRVMKLYEEVFEEFHFI
jgi:hypothetical protein